MSIKDWISSIDEITGQFSRLLNLREIYEELKTIINGNPTIQKPSSFYSWIYETYSTTIAIGIRRLVYPSQEATCLIKLLSEMGKTPTLLSRQYYVGLYPCGDKVFAERHYDNLVGPGMASPDAKAIENDKNQIAKIVGPIKEYADHHIAHIASSPPQNVTTWGDLAKSFTEIERIIQKYRALLKASTGDLKPVIQGNWKAIFKYPWIP